MKKWARRKEDSKDYKKRLFLFKTAVHSLYLVILIPIILLFLFFNKGNELYISLIITFLAIFILCFFQDKICNEIGKKMNITENDVEELIEDLNNDDSSGG